jgi:hypothetical protein
MNTSYWCDLDFVMKQEFEAGVTDEMEVTFTLISDSVYKLQLNRADGSTC